MNEKPNLSALRVFLIEDYGPIRRRIASLIETLTDVVVVGEAEDVPTALAGIVASAADVVIVDLRLTHGSGLELLASLSHEGAQVISIVLTNHTDQAFRNACLSAGAHFVFDKTAEFERAKGVLEKLAGQRQHPSVKLE